MISVDTSTWIAFFQGDAGKDVDILCEALENSQLLLSPVVFSELLSDFKLPRKTFLHLSSLPQITLGPDFWKNAGLLRARTLALKKKARLADVLILQSCIDADIPLVTRDHDFRHYKNEVSIDLLIF